MPAKGLVITGLSINQITENFTVSAKHNNCALGELGIEMLQKIDDGGVILNGNSQTETVDNNQNNGVIADEVFLPRPMPPIQKYKYGRLVFRAYPTFAPVICSERESYEREIKKHLALKSSGC